MYAFDTLRCRAVIFVLFSFVSCVGAAIYANKDVYTQDGDVTESIVATRPPFCGFNTP